MRARAPWLMLAGSVCALAVSAHASAQDAGASAAPVPSESQERVRTTGACVEHIPEGKARPAMVESFPERIKAGYAALLRLEIPHGKGESVLPGGFKLRLDSPEGKAIGAAHFVIPAPEGPSGPQITRRDAESGSVTTVELAFVPLPKQAGTQTLTLPSVPIALARASGEVITLCTAPHDLRVDDPTANIAQATPRPNPAPRSQLEVWTAAKNAVLGALVALPLGALIAFLISRWRRREKPKPPPLPPRPPWEVALEALAGIRRRNLVEQGQATEHFAEVSSAVRRYLGDLYGFDGLESTTSETLGELARARPSAEVTSEVERFLRRADLVKFANLTPTHAECEAALAEGELIVRRTMAERSAQAPAATDGVPMLEAGRPVS